MDAHDVALMVLAVLLAVGLIGIVTAVTGGVFVFWRALLAAGIGVLAGHMLRRPR